MRSNAPITAILALAVLFFLPAGSSAKTAHRRVSKPIAAHSSHARESRKKTSAKSVRETHASNRRASQKTVSAHAHQTRARELRTRDLRVRERISPRDRRRHIIAREIPVEQARTTAPAASSTKATSEDFLKAASNPPSVTPAPLEIHGTVHPREQNQPTAVSRKTAAKPVPVVSVIRPASERPQLRSVEEVASTPVILPALYNKRGRLIVPPALKGSHEILVHQNLMADHDGLRRIQDDADLFNMRNQGLLVPLPLSNVLEVDDRLPANRRFCRSWTAQFLATLARAHYAHFHTTLQVNSAVRTVEFQQHLTHINGNAAPWEGDTASPHLTGQAIDIAKHGLSVTEIAWLRGYLLPLVQEGKIDVEEEFQQSCFHISVYKRYVPSAEASRRNIASIHRTETGDLATAIR